MKIYRETIVAGRTIIRSLKASTRIKTAKGEKRQPKKNPSSDAVRKINFKNAVKRLTAILNHNFIPGDYHLTLTYKDEPTKEEARKNLDKFIRNLRGAYGRAGRTLKYVAVTEYENHRVHHHVVVTETDPDTLGRLWKYGYINIKMLESDGNYYKLAEYLIKETEKTFRNPDAIQKRRYSCSRSIVLPEVKKELVSERELAKAPQAVKGYYIDEDTVRRYDHAILGVECLEYIMVSIEQEPRHKRWHKGKRGRYERRYQEERQITMGGHK